MMAGRTRTVARIAATGLVGLAGVTGLGLVLAGGASAHGAHHVLLADGSTNTPAPTSASFTLNVSLTTGGTTTTVNGSGQVDFANAAASATVTVPPMAPFTTTATTLSADFVGNTVYVSVPASFSSLFGGAQWTSIALPATDTGDVSSGFNAVAGGLGNIQSVLTTLEAHAGTVSDLGTSTVDGGPATGYKVSFDVAKLLADVPELPAGLAAKILAATGPTIPLTLWADAQGRLVQASASDTVTTPTGTTAVAATLDISGYDAPVTIEAPPAAQTKPLPAWMTAMATSMAGKAGHHGHGSLTAHGHWAGHHRPL